MYESVTQGIVVRVQPDFLEGESTPEENRYFWSYRVEIENRTGESVQLMTREWRITDARGRTRIVKGEGVVGEQPVIRPGERFTYTSGAPLETSSGFMSGFYGMKISDGTPFLATIPAFALDYPFDNTTLH
ncbi:Co2+/Mg2+ efflux protein ApaG [Woodsholea maritima]|uniref:Co2+/Mg2+ efflux protein ApaG n=1 Tax=Woodsholea maritima TaxID=240237 RepID=UPI00036162F0|nr:Co2+/Mg2+ efflux protein ApaG [Woodsholea maritima]